MTTKTAIEWAQYTWNPAHGCSPVSEGCENCYARAFARRLAGTKSPKYANGFKPTCHWDMLDEPYRWHKPRQVFVCSMGDLWHRDVPWRFRQRVFTVCRECHRHTFLFLTKRPEEFHRTDFGAKPPENAWVGVSVESQAYLERIVTLIGRVPRPMSRFVSFEPLLGRVDMPAAWWKSIEWIIVGGETGHNAREMDLDWARALRDDSMEHGIPFFFKRAGSAYGKLGNVTTLDGREWRGVPYGRIYAKPTG
jgi:protein gp37